MTLAPAALAAVVLFAQLGQAPGDYADRAGRVGMVIDKRNGAIVVEEITPKSSAEKAGIQIGDQILRIDLDNTQDMGQSAAIGALRGIHGTRVSLTILPRGAMVPRTVEVVRDVKIYGGADSGIVGDVVDPAMREGVKKRPTVEAKLEDITVEHSPKSLEEMRELFGRASPDVATCVGALRELLPNDLAGIGATFTFRKDGAVSVRSEPPSADVATCFGRATTKWKVPKPGKEPIVVKARWSLIRN